MKKQLTSAEAAARHKYYNREHELVYLPNELIRCSECERTMSMKEWKDKPCSGHPASPPAEKAEALPELPDILLLAIMDYSDSLTVGRKERMLHLSRLLLAECHRIAREEADKVRPSLLDKIFDIAHGAARKELSKAHIESRAGEFWNARIVPGKEGE